MTTEAQTKVCPHCGEEINTGAKKCKHCLKWIETNPQQATKPIVLVINPKDILRALPYIVLGGIALVALIICVVMLIQARSVMDDLGALLILIISVIAFAAIPIYAQLECISKKLNNKGE